MEKKYISEKELFDKDPFLPEVLMMAVYYQELSTTAVQRRWEIGYPRAARMVDILEELGFTSVENGVRKVNISQEEFEKEYGWKYEDLEAIFDEEKSAKVIKMKNDVKDLKLEKVQFFNENGEKLSKNDEKIIKNEFLSNFDSKNVITIDAKDARNFLESKDYKLRCRKKKISTPFEMARLTNSIEDSAMIMMDVGPDTMPNTLLFQQIKLKEAILSIQVRDDLAGNETEVTILY